MRKGHHHFYLPAVLLAFFLIVLFLYKVFVVNDFLGRVWSSVFAPAPSTQNNLIIILTKDGKRKEFSVKGEVRVKDGMILIVSPNQKVYYPVPKGSEVIVRKIN